MGEIQTDLKIQFQLHLQYMLYVLFKTGVMRLDLTLFGSSGMERIVQKFVSEEINPRTDISNVNVFGILVAGIFDVSIIVL